MENEDFGGVQKRFQMQLKQGSKKKKVAIIAIAALLILLGAFVYYYVVYCSEVPMPKEIKLFDCTEKTTTTNFVLPHGFLYEFVVGVSNVPAKITDKMAVSFAGTLSLAKNNIVVTNIAFNKTTIHWCNWLDDYGLTAYVLSYSNGFYIDDSVHGGDTIAIVLELAEPISNGSFWLSYIDVYEGR